MIRITQNQAEEIFAHARQELPHECCGLIGGRDDFACSVYRMRNVAANPSIEYEAATVDLFRAQRTMRERRETLLGIYHSHPRQNDPLPSQTDVARAFYPEAVYFIVGFEGGAPTLSAFKLYEAEQRSEKIEFIVVD